MNTNDKKIFILGEEAIPKALLKLSTPMILGMLINAIYNVVNALFVGGLGTSQMGAVSVAFPISMLVVGVGLTFGSGAGSYISRLLGEGRHDQASRTASTAVLTSIVAGGCLIAVILGFLEPVLTFLGATDTIMPYATAYATLYIGSSMLNVFNVTMNNIVASEGAAKFSMIAMLLGAGLNIILDPIFIYGLNWGIRGAAIATMVAQGTTTILYLWYILSRKSFVKISFHNFSLDGEIYRQILKVGVPTFIFQILTSVSIGLTNTAASHYGDTAVASMGIVTRIYSIFSFVVFGFTKGFQPLAGYSYGAKKYDRLQDTIRIGIKWSSWFCGIGAFILIVFSRPIIALFSNDPDVIRIGSQALIANCSMFIFFGFQMVYITLFLAIGKAKEGAMLSMCRQGVFFIPTLLILPQFMGLNGVIISQAVADFLTVLLTVSFAWKMRKNVSGVVTG
ncbi:MULTISPECIES: MATE family efflux transporter [unclassified Paenibacillus]|uniref:MATE family efflux transporter n=1 Tax=unclassified Paenibacillus TaxID=185978 RepID=UPI0003E22EFA|nr:MULTISPECIES: MATE family efflux transporter [unclassified Paenibacillus]ETT49796.1 Na+ driven multidrug efflux pump [Paenibacillus sp. FSL R7-269]OMF89005.1 MATE family efflux transporter [Paenibacillus sp. FSL R7-0337]